MDLDAIRTELETSRTELDAELASITAVPLDPMAALSFGKRIGDGTTEAVERLNKIGVADALEAKRKDVRRALEKLDEGSYGECDKCGNRIPEERLEARPATTRCIDCASS
jgi:DnaK suppressor protein